jgi:Tol biopolymer transport system component
MMPDVDDLLKREGDTVELERGHFERLLRRRDRKRRNRRIRAGALALIVALASFGALARAFSTEERPADEPPKPNFSGMVITYTGVDPRAGGELVGQDPVTGVVRSLVDAQGASSRFRTRLIGSAAPSADGRWVAFEVVACGGGFTDEEGAGGLWVTNGLDEPRQVTKPCFEDPAVEHYNTLWAWSPVGAQLLVERISADGDALFLVDAATGDRTDLGTTVGDVTAFAWSPDGTRIAYGTRQGSVYSVNVDDGDHSLLARLPDSSVAGGVYGPGFGITWSPDGAHIAVQVGHTRDNSPVDTLYFMNADGSDVRQVAEGSKVQGVYFGPNLSWSPDGTRMAFATWSGRREDRQQIWTASPDGSTPILLFEAASAASADFGSAGSPVWSPDGERIAFGSATTNGKAVWLVANADGTGVAREINELQYLSWRGGWYFCGCYG